MSGIKEAIKKLGAAIGDFSSLEVQTITGEISAVTGESEIEKLENIVREKKDAADAATTQPKKNSTAKELKAAKENLETANANIPSSGGSIIDWKTAIASARTGVEVNLVMATKINFDGDATLFISSTEIPSYVMEAHSKAVEAGLKVRSDIASFAADSIKGLIK